jgi:hypothetical protein
MTPGQKHLLNTLLVKLVTLIRTATVSDVVKGKARTIVDYYLYNPFTEKDVKFFHLLHGSQFYTDHMRDAYSPSHTHSADRRYVPMLTHMLSTNYNLLEAELERMGMLADLPLDGSITPTAEELRNRFVEALALYVDINHADYKAICWTIPRHVFRESIYAAA